MKNLRRLLGIASLLCVVVVAANCATGQRAIVSMDTGAPDHITTGRSKVNSLVNKLELANGTVEIKCAAGAIDATTCAKVSVVHRAAKLGITTLNSLLTRWALAGSDDKEAKAAFQNEYISQARSVSKDIEKMNGVRDSAAPPVLETE